MRRFDEVQRGNLFSSPSPTSRASPDGSPRRRSVTETGTYPRFRASSIHNYPPHGAPSPPDVEVPNSASPPGREESSASPPSLVGILSPDVLPTPFPTHKADTANAFFADWPPDNFRAEKADSADESSHRSSRHNSTSIARGHDIWAQLDSAEQERRSQAPVLMERNRTPGISDREASQSIFFPGAAPDARQNPIDFGQDTALMETLLSDWARDSDEEDEDRVEIEVNEEQTGWTAGQQRGSTLGLSTFSDRGLTSQHGHMDRRHEQEEHRRHMSEHEDVDGLPGPMSEGVPSPFFRDLDISVKVQAFLPQTEARVNECFIATKDASYRYSYLRTKSEWMTHLFANRDNQSMLAVDSLPSQTESMYTPFTKLHMHPQFQVFALVEGSYVSIRHMYDLSLVTNLDVRAMIVKKHPRIDQLTLFGPSPQMNCVQWHRSSLTLAVSYGNCVCVLGPCRDTLNLLPGRSIAPDAQLLRNEKWARWIPQARGIDTMKIVGLLMMQHPSLGVAWIHDHLITTATPANYVVRRWIDEGSLYIWPCEFEETHESVSVTPENDRPSVFTKANALGNEHLCDLRIFHSVAAEPTHGWSVRSSLPVMWIRTRERMMMHATVRSSRPSHSLCTEHFIEDGS